MGFTRDLWTAMLSDDGVECTEALDRLFTDTVASDIAATDLGLEGPRPLDKPTEVRDVDAE